MDQKMIILLMYIENLILICFKLRKGLIKYDININRSTQSWLSHVPAAAVIRERQALLVINGSKG
jgi:hypothetical protein